MNDVAQWLARLGFAQYVEVFDDNDIDEEVLPELTDADLEKLGVSSLGHRKKLLKAIAALEAPGTADAPRPSAPVLTPPLSDSRQEAERRQLTVMFCDLVGSTELSTRLDPEDMRELMSAFQDMSREAVQRYAGFIARYMGDGILVYFGYPQAHEDDAVRAVRAGLTIVDSMSSRNNSVRKRHGLVLAVRIGVATGPVVVGDIVGEGAAEEAAVVGETPNLAARLQGIAGHNQVVIAPVTRRLLGPLFEYEDLGTHQLKGIAQPMPAWRVVRESGVDGGYEAKRSVGRAPLIGRQEELGLLLRSWEATKEGHGQVVLIQGEPGIGKSRLLEALRERVMGEDYLWIAARCSPYHTHSTLYPVIEHLKRALDWKPDDDAEKKIQKLETLLQRQSLPPEEVVPLYAELLSLPLPEDRYLHLNLDAKQKRERTLDALSGWLLEEAERKPVLHVWEDLHWADPTTLELLGLYIGQSPTVAMLNVLTYRPDFAPPWTMRSHMTPITLNRLERPEVEALIGHQAGGKSVPPEVIEHIVAKADGVPLYVEELTKTILESEYLREDADRFTLDGSLSELAIPATLQDSLMARLDRLPTVREIAQLGAVLGREFAYEMLKSLASHDEPVLQDGLNRLVKDDLLYQRGRPPRSKYIFKHALIQDVAYQSLLKRRRRQYHEQVARLLEERFGETVVVHPELVAHHYQEAGCTKKAVAYWLMAGQRSVARSANMEAIAHLMNGLDLIPDLPSESEANDLELDMQITLGSARIAARGYSAEETEDAWLRARELLGDVKEDSRQFAVLHGLCMVYWNRAQLDRMREVNEDMLRRAERQKDVLPRLVAHRVTAVGFNPMGKFEEARRHAQEATELYDPDAHADTAHRFGHDQGVGAYWHLAISLLFLGYPDASANAAARAFELTAKLGNVNTNFYTALWSSFTDLVRRDWHGAKETASQMVDQADELSMPLWVAFGRYLLGCSLISLGDVESGLNEIHMGRKNAEALNNSIFKPMTLRFEAQALAASGRYSDALGCLDEALHIVAQTQERWWESDIHRLKANCGLATGGDKGDTEAVLNHAIAVASNQKSRLLELRCAIDLAMHWRERGKGSQARAMLTPIYEWFSEGHDTPDLQQARALIEG